MNVDNGEKSQSGEQLPTSRHRGDCQKTVVTNEKHDRSFSKKNRKFKRRLTLARIGGNFPTFQKPSVIGQFSVNKQREFEPNCKQMKYLKYNYNMRVSFDLNKGMRYCIRKNHKPEHLNHIFHWLRKHNYIINGKINSQLNDVVVCFRGLLTTILCTPYEEKEGWIICAKQYNKTIFLCAFDTEEKLEKKENETKRQKQMCSWGYKFEQYMVSEHPKANPNTDEPVNENEEWCCMFSSKLQGHKLLYGAEIDCVLSNDVIDVDKNPYCLQKVDFIELKTNRHIEKDHENRQFRRYKMLKWWCQSFLVGIQTVVCGFRNNSGVVGRLEQFSVRDLPKRAKDFWEPTICMNSCIQFLKLVKSCLKEAEDSVWKFEWSPGKDIIATNLGDDPFYNFLPEWLPKSQ